MKMPSIMCMSCLRFKFSPIHWGARMLGMCDGDSLKQYNKHKGYKPGRDEFRANYERAFGRPWDEAVDESRKNKKESI